MVEFAAPAQEAAQGIQHRKLRHDYSRILRLVGGGEQAAGKPRRIHQGENLHLGESGGASAGASKWTLLISECADRELKFILYCGFHAGLRKGEIVQARPEWFDLKLNIIHITESETWKPKDKDKRTIPLTTAFKKFLEEEMAIDGELPSPFLIYPNKVQGKARYRYDFRKPFEEYVAGERLWWLKPHSCAIRLPVCSLSQASPFSRLRSG